MSIFPFIDASGVTDTKKVTDLPLLKDEVRDEIVAKVTAALM